MRAFWLLLCAAPLYGQQQRVMADSIVPHAPVTTLSQLLTARVPGLTVLSQDGSVGASPVLAIRGYSGGPTVSRPLLIVDGIRVDNAGGTGTAIPPLAYHPATGRFDDIDPADIARIDILPGAAAASIYGPGAGNGVILVTTKRRGGSPIAGEISAEGGVATTAVDAPQSYFSWGHQGAQTGQCPLEAQAEQLCTLDSISHYNPLPHSIVPAYTQRYGALVGATFGAAQLSVSGHYTDQPGTLELPPADRAVYRTDLGSQPSPDQIRPSAFDQGQVRATLVSHFGSNADVSGTFGYIGTHQRDGAIDSFLSDAGLGLGSRGLFDGWAGPVSRPAFDLTDVSTDHAAHVLYNVQGTWRPLAPLSLHATAGIDYVHRTTGDAAINFGSNGPDTIANRYGQRLTQYTADVGGTWTATIVPALESRTSIGLQYLAANGNDSALSSNGTAGSIATNISALHLADFTHSAYLDQAFEIANKVSVNGTVRWDHHRLESSHVSSTVAYPSVSASWAVLGTSSDPRVRLRSALGETITPIGTMQLAALALPLQAMLPPLRPATRQREVEGGIDASLPGNRVTASLTTYARRTVHAILPFTVSDNIGGLVRVADQGTVSDRGIEFSTTARIVERPTLAWDATLTASEHWNKVLRTPDELTWYDGALRVAAGFPAYGFWVVPYTYADANHDGVIEVSEITTKPQVFAGSTVPTHEASLASTWHFFKRTVHVSTLFDYRGGYVLPDQNSLYQSVIFAARVQNVAGASLSQQARAAAAVAGPGWPQGYADRVSAVRWRELSVTSALPVPRPISVTVAVRNLALWTKYRGDPDIALVEQPPNISSIAPTLQLPQPRIWLLRVTAGF
ncbi:MAG TPA: TonB-dependent receptor plug domain-containing protein [Gemmatimonadaceae bacterium]|nr:TonB-dependent receptor plug domain-containing protein [Gemmatimonadaceae bacterium]